MYANMFIIFIVTMCMHVLFKMSKTQRLWPEVMAHNMFADMVTS